MLRLSWAGAHAAEQAEIERLQRLIRDSIRLGATLCGDVDELLLRDDAAKAAADVQREVLEGMLGRDVRDELSRLAARNPHVLVRRYRLDGREPQTLEEVGHELSLSKQRIHQIEHAAAVRLRMVMVELGYGPQ